MRKGLILITFALVAASCGGSDEPAAASTAAPESVASPGDVVTTAPATTAPTVTAATGDTETAAAPPVTEAGPSFDGPPAPDFELVLSDGSTFTLSDEQKPVYVVFWAEW